MIPNFLVRYKNLKNYFPLFRIFENLQQSKAILISRKGGIQIHLHQEETTRRTIAVLMEFHHDAETKSEEF